MHWLRWQGCTEQMALQGAVAQEHRFKPHEERASRTLMVSNGCLQSTTM